MDTNFGVFFKHYFYSPLTQCEKYGASASSSSSWSVRRKQRCYVYGRYEFSEAYLRDSSNLFFNSCSPTSAQCCSSKRLINETQIKTIK